MNKNLYLITGTDVLEREEQLEKMSLLKKNCNY